MLKALLTEQHKVRRCAPDEITLQRSPSLRFSAARKVAISGLSRRNAVKAERTQRFVHCIRIRH